MPTAIFQIRLSYIGPNDESVTAPHVSKSVLYGEGAQLVGGIDVPDAAASGTEFAVPFGVIAEATGFVLENRSGQEIRARLEAANGSATGTLVAGTVTIAFAAVPGERLSVEVVDDNGGTPGILSVRRSAGNVIVESWVAGVGLQVADVSDVIVYNNAGPALPDEATLVYASPTAPAAAALGSASVWLTALQVGAGSVVTKVFGDPV